MTLDIGVARENMVENQVRTNDVTDVRVQDAMRAVPRERFCPPGKLHLAYAEIEVEYAPGYRLMAPRDVSKLLQTLQLREGERALAICAPYAAALLNQIGLKTTLRLPEAAAAGMKDALAGADVTVEVGDPAQAPNGPYDVIVVEGAVARTPKAWTEALAVGGRLGVVERTGPVGKARLYIHAEDGRSGMRELFDATPALLPGFEPAPPAFAF